MRFFAIIAAFAATLATATAFDKGFNIANPNPDGSGKTEDQWHTAFNQLKSLRQDFTNVRVYACSDYGTLANAVPAAISTGTKILVGVWTQDWEHYGAEKAALQAAIQQHGHDWIYAISVGSEDLYRRETSAATLAGQIYDVKGMVRQWIPESILVGHVDTFQSWTNTSNEAVITASDFIGMDGYPYWQGSAIEDGFKAFWTTVEQTKAVAKGKPVWITETAWPVAGDPVGAAVPSVKNAQTYWHSVACQAFNEITVFWYVYEDYNASPSFGLFDKNGQPNYDIVSCPPPPTM